MSMTNINIRTDSEVKLQAQTLFANLGLDMTTAINMFLRQSVRQQALPLDFFLGDDGEETLAQSLADMDSGIRGL
ncbi:MAG: type II toxin-antitoxin system RelB/DinJ family antitoxin, partial [Oscillospiraceae bacterium]|nr:type II toxin-antitoxin system RelB/DinJ family antitoxin [Oscillospiraceae bacterium]